MQRDAKVTHYMWNFIDLVEGHQLQLTNNKDKSRTFVAIYMHENRLYILEGTVSILDGKDWVTCHAGDFAHVPAGGIHGFRNSDGPAKMLLHFAPGAPREAYFEGLAEGMGRLDGEAYDRFMREHDNTWV